MLRLLLLLIGALCARLWAASRVPLIDHDGALYAGLAAAQRAGDLRHGLSSIWPPLYPALTALASFATGYDPSHPDPLALEHAARLVSVLAGTGTVAAVFALARAGAGTRAAWIAAALAAFHPRLIQYSAATLAESCFMLALTTGLALVATPRGTVRSILAGGLFGLSFLARPEGLVLALPAIVVAPGWRAGRRLAFLAALFLVALPYVGWMSSESGHFTLGEKAGYNLWKSFRNEYRLVDPSYERSVSRFAESRELEERVPPVAMRPFALLKVAAGPVVVQSLARLARLVFETLPLACHVPWFLLALAGFAVWKRPPLAPVAGVLIAMPLLYAPFSVDRRFLVPAVPLLMIPAAYALEISWARGGTRRTLAAAALALLCAGGLAYAIATVARDDASEHRAAGAWLAQWSAHEGIARPVVMSRKTWVAFYSGGLIAELPDGDVGDVRRRIAANGTDALIVDERWAVPNRPALAPLLDPSAAPPGFVPVHEITTPRRLVIYDVRSLSTR